MRNITVTVSDKAYHEARVFAAQQDTSVSAIVQSLITRLTRMPVGKPSNPDAKPASETPQIAPQTAISAPKTAL